MSKKITRRMLKEMIKEELALGDRLLLESSILNKPLEIPSGNETHVVKIFDNGGSDYGLLLNDVLYDIKARAKGMKFFLRPVSAIWGSSGLDISFQPRKMGRNWGGERGGLLPVRDFAAILKSLLQRESWEGIFITLDDGEESSVTMEIKKA